MWNPCRRLVTSPGDQSALWNKAATNLPSIWKTAGSKKLPALHKKLPAGLPAEVTKNQSERAGQGEWRDARCWNFSPQA